MKIIKIRDIGRIVTGTTPSTKEPLNYGSQDIMFVGPSDIKNNRYITNTEKHISYFAYNNLPTRRLTKSSLVIDCIGSDMGNVAITTCDCITNQQINAITDIQDNNALYFYYLFSTKKHYFHQIGMNGSTMPIINKSLFDDIEILIHNNEQQQHIVNILGSIDDKIENNEKKVIKLEAFKQQLFVQYEDSSDKCEEIKLSSIIKFIKGKKPLDNKINLDNYLNIEGITSNIYEQQCSNKMVMANEDDILMVMDGASSGTIYTGHKGIVSSTLSKLEILENQYKFLVMEKLIQMNSKIKELNTGSAIPHTNKEFILSLSIDVKNGKQLDMFNSKISNIQNKIIDIKKQNVKLNNLKQLYLKKFFN